MSPTGGKPNVDHTYRDLSRYLQKCGEVVKHKKYGANFPAKLHRMLSEPEFSCIIFWLPHGRTFKIRNKDLLMSTAVPEYFGQTKFESFTRQLSGWGFKRLHQPGPDYGCYYHECFLRGLPLLTGLMRRVPSNQGKATPFPEGEPDFYLISKLYPLPSEDPEDSSSHAAASHADAASAKTQPSPLSNSLYEHNSMMPVVHSHSSPNSKLASRMHYTSMPDVQSSEMTTGSHVAPNLSHSLKVRSAEESTESDLKSDNSSLKSIATRPDAASHMIHASQLAQNVQDEDWNNYAQNAMVHNMAIPPQDSTMSLSGAATDGATASWASMRMPTMSPSTILGAQNEMIPTAQANLPEISRAHHTTNEIRTASMPGVHSYEKNTEFLAAISEAERVRLPPDTRKRASSVTDQSLLGQARPSMISDARAVMEAFASYQVPISRNQSVQESSAATIFPLEPSAAPAFLNNQAPSQHSRWPLPLPLSNIESANSPKRQPPQNPSMAAMFQEAPVADFSSMNNQSSFQFPNNDSLLPRYSQSNIDYSFGSTDYTSTETTKPYDSRHQFQNIQGQLESSHLMQEDHEPSSREQEEVSSVPESLGGDDRNSFYDDMNALLDTL